MIIWIFFSLVSEDVSDKQNEKFHEDIAFAENGSNKKIFVIYQDITFGEFKSPINVTKNLVNPLDLHK